MKKIIGLFTLALLLITSLSAEIINLDDYYETKVRIYNNSDDEKDLDLLQNELEVLRKNESKYDIELFLAIENNLTTDIADLTPKSNDTKKKIYLMLSAQNKKNKDYMDGKKLKKLDSYYLVSVADLKCRFIDYLAKQENYEESMFAEELYKQAIKNDKKNAMAYVGHGTWLFFAPPIVGGGIEAANEKYETAVKKATNENVKYLSLIYYSQSLYSLGEEELYEEVLKEAFDLVHKDTFIKAVREVNEKDLLFFE